MSCRPIVANGQLGSWRGSCVVSAHCGASAPTEPKMRDVAPESEVLTTQCAWCKRLKGADGEYHGDPVPMDGRTRMAFVMNAKPRRGRSSRHPSEC
jgi:hypothetical protein